MAIAFVLFPASAGATGNHHSAPMGGRSALMGGTGVAIGVDGAAPFLNPATITRIGTSRIAFSARFYRFSEETVENFQQAGPADEDRFGDLRFANTSESHQRVHSVPDSVCYFFPAIAELAARQRLSLCLSKTETQQLSLKALGYQGTSDGFRINQAQTFEVDWSRFHFGPTWGVVLSDELSFGVALLVAFTRYSHELVSSTIVEDTATGAASTSSYESIASAFSWDLAPRLGVTYQLSNRVSLGASVTTPLLHVLGGVRQSYATEFDAARTQWAADTGFRAGPPWELRLGVGGEWESLRFEVDGFLTAGESDYARGTLHAEQVSVDAGQVTSRETIAMEVNEASKTTVNVGAGAEMFVAHRLSLLAGFQTDFNGLQKLDPRAERARLFRTRLDYYRAGLGLCSYTDFGDLMFGLRFDYGTGQALPVNTLTDPPSLALADVRDVGIMVVLAGSINWESISQAAGDVTDIVRGTSRPPPAKPPAPLRQPKQE